MKILKLKYILSFAVVMSLVLFMGSCTNDDVFQSADGEVDFTTLGVNYNKEGSLVLLSNVVNGFYDLGDLANASVGFKLSTVGDAVNSVDVNVSYGGQTKLLSTVSSFPATVSLPLSSVLSALGVSSSALKVGDQFRFSLSNVVTANGAYSSGTSLTVPVSCTSNLAGTYNYTSTNLQADNGYGCPAGSVTGTVTFTALGGGRYNCSDLGFGQYGSSCWGDSPATGPNANFTDVCNRITSGGLDQYGLAYTWIIKSVSGADLSMSWFNNYGDRGDVVITRPDGSSWPALFTQ